MICGCEPGKRFCAKAAFLQRKGQEAAAIGHYNYSQHLFKALWEHLKFYRDLEKARRRNQRTRKPKKIYAAQSQVHFVPNVRDWDIHLKIRDSISLSESEKAA